MRVFYALTFTKADQDKIGHYKELVANQIIKASYTQNHNIHLTLSFIGEVSQKKLNDYEEILDQISLSSVTLDCRHIGIFRKKKNRDILWLGVEKNPNLSQIVKALNQSLRDADLDFDDRKFTPHITLGRNIRSHVDLSQLVIQPIKIKPKSIALMISHRKHDQLIYEPIYEIQLPK